MMTQTVVSQLLLLIIVVLLLLVLHKSRRMHIAMYSLQSDAVATRKEVESLFDQIQAYTALERLLSMKRALPPMRGWAGSPDFLLQVAQWIQEKQPKCIVECSSGVSTIVAARSLQILGRGHVYSLEHEAEYAAKTEKMLKDFGLTDFATVITAPLVAGIDSTPWYDQKRLPESLPEIDMLVVDGPPERTAPLARYPALPCLMPRMAERFVVMLDDADRPDELETVRRWKQQSPSLVETRPRCEKGLAILEGQRK